MSSGERIGRGRRSRRSRRRRGGGRGEKREETEPTPTPVPSPSRRTEQREPARGRDQRGGADGDRDRRRRGGRGRGDDRESSQRSEPRSEPRPESRRQEPRQRSPERERPERPGPAGPPSVGSTVAPTQPKVGFTESVAPLESPAPRPTPPSVRSGEQRQPGEAVLAPSPLELDVPSREELQKRAEAALAEILRRMGFPARVTSFYDDQDSEIVIAVESEAEGLLIGRRGQTLDALEHVINRIVLSGEMSAEGRLAIDVGGYRQRRRETLLELADRLKVRALTQGRRIQVSPMSPRDRRILQGALSRDETVRMRVLGSGFYRRVVIFPVGLDEAGTPLDVETEDVPGGEPLEADDEQV